MKSEYRAKIQEYIQAHREEMVSRLMELVRIPSVKGVTAAEVPFGPACADVLEYTQKLYRENDLETELCSEGGYLLSYYGEGEKSLGLFAHGDVVAAGEDWIYTDPFTPIEKDGFLIGRGVLDDKAAIVISLYCVKMLKELSLPFHSRLVCFTGGNEESGMQDIKNYTACHKSPDFSLVCDTGYPPFRGNKGRLQAVACAETPLHDIVDFTGGVSPNVVLGKVTVKLKYSRELYGELQEIAAREIKENRLRLSASGETILLTSEGITSHAALPEGSLNAGLVAARVLSQSCVLREEDRRQMQFVGELLAHYYGEALDIANEDPEFGRLTCANGVIRLQEGKLRLSFDIRFGKCADLEGFKKKMADVLAANNWASEFLQEEKAHAVPADHPYVQTCLQVYREFTGDREGESRINAGGTYGRHLPCAVEIGPTIGADECPLEMPAGHGHVHEPDEYISIDGLLNATELTMLMLLECDRI